MFARTIKKALLFFFVDIVIIIGIFVLQFSNDSIITEKNGILQITLAETKDNNNLSVLRNKLILAFNGVTVSCDDSKPAAILRKGNDVAENIVLKTWEKQGETDYVFGFSDDVVLTVKLTDTTEKGAISFSVDLPEGVDQFIIPYTLASNTEIAVRSDKRLLLGNKKAAWEFTAPSLADSTLVFTSAKPSAQYAFFEQTVEFKFASLSGSPLVSDYNNVVRVFRDSIISSYKANTAEALSNEQAVVAYVAEQASRGNYNSAIEEIPQSFKKSENRTYLSAPFFNNLAAMNKTLDAAIEEKNAIIRKAYNNNSLSLLTLRNIADYMYLYDNSSVIKRITERAGEVNVGQCSLAEAAGILRTYIEMMPLSKAYASHMEPSLNECVNKIEKACKMEGTNLTISENGTFLSVVQAVEVGDALLRYGEFIGDQSLIAGGKAIITSYMGECTSFDNRTLSDLYPVIVHGNTNYPHFVKIVTSGDTVVWAWTVAKSVGYERGEDRSLTFTLDFPLEQTHYVILRGISPFRGIYIYDMAFRTDPRFENYNSSGYVYENETKSLLLKSRHKSEKETIRLIYSAPAVQERPQVEPTETESASSEEETIVRPLTPEELLQKQREAEEKAARDEAIRRAQEASASDNS